MMAWFRNGPWSRSLTARLVMWFLGLAALTMLGASALAYAGARAALTQAVYQRLEDMAQVREADLADWITAQRSDVTFLAAQPDVQTHVARLFAQPNPIDRLNPDYDALRQYFTAALQAKPDFSEIFLMTDVGGWIVFSTDPAHEDDYRPKDTYFIEGRQGTFVQNVYPGPVTLRPMLTIATPLVDAGGARLGVLAVHLNLERLDQIEQRSTDIGPGGEIYLVDKLNEFVSAARFGRDDFPRGVHSPGIDAAVLTHQNGAGLYTNYAGVPVVGAYRWVKPLELALVVEMPQRDAFAPASQLGLTLLGLGLALALLQGGAILLLARQITRPILAVTQSAVRVGQGDLTQSAPVLTQDEIGTLARTFNRMTAELRQSYAAVRESERKARAIFDSAFSLIGLLASDGTLLEANRTALEFAGVSLEAVRGKPFWDAPWWTHSPEMQRLVQAAVQTAAGGTLARFEAIHRAADGTLRTLDFSLKPVTDENGQVSLLIPEGRDITERKQADEALRASEARFRSSFENTLIGLYRTTPGGRILMANPALCRIMGYSSVEAMQAINLEAEFGASYNRADFRREIETKGVITGWETMWTRRDGTTVWVRETARAMRAASGEVLYYEGTVEDITDRRRAEEALRESEIKLSAIFNNSVDGIFVAKDDLCVMANPALLRMLRCPTAADVVGQPVTRRVAPEDAARVAENIRRRARGEPAPTLTEATVLRLDGTTFLAEGHNSIYVLNGEQYLLTILRDITERKSTDLLKMQLEVLRQVDKLRAQLVGNVSHELRTPLGLILGIAAILRQTEPPLPESERQEFLKDIEEEAERLAAIVDGLLDAERMQAGRLVLRCRRLDLRLVVTAETEALVRRDRQHHFAVELPERPVWGDLDANRLGQVVHNLLDNAIKYTPADTTIRTRVERRQAELWVSVEDEGPGIPSDQLERIFERFHRLTEQNDTTTPGLGLGLAICRGIVEMHGGRIWAESPVALGRGSRFVFTLPEMAPTQEGKSDEY